jgi:5-hydroxyisourate hydrolase
VSMDRIKQDLRAAKQEFGIGGETTLSTHVLDAALGRPAAGMTITVTAPDGTVVSGKTDADGRARVPGNVQPGTNTIVYATGPWFDAQERETFYPEIEVRFTVTGGEHHHVAVLLSPFAYTTYRGS